MLKNLSVPGREVQENLPRIKVLGIGGAGGNAVDNMIASKMTGVEFLVCNTDAQALLNSRCEHRLQLGQETTQGLGAGSIPEVGRKAAEESIDEIRSYLEDAQMLFLATGMGGGTGTGATPVIARVAKELKILTVAVVATPFGFEGKERMQYAEQGVQELQEIVDTLLVISNQSLFSISSDSTKMQDAFATADEVLASGVRSITDLVTRPGLINRDFADVRSVMTQGGRALISTVETDGDNRAERAAEAVIINPLLEKVDIATAKKLLINVVGGEDMTLFEMQEIASRICQSVEGSPSVSFGCATDAALEGRLRVSVVATGIEVPGCDAQLGDGEDAEEKAAMWFDTHQRARRKETDSAEEGEAPALTSDRPPTREGTPKKLKAKGFRAELRQHIEPRVADSNWQPTPERRTKSTPSVSAPRVFAPRVSAPPLVHADMNASNVGRVQSALGAVKDFFGLKRETIAHEPHYGSPPLHDVMPLPLEGATHAGQEEAPTSLPAFMKRQRD